MHFRFIYYIYIYSKNWLLGGRFGEFFEGGGQQTVTFIELDMPCGGYDLL